MGVQLNVCFGHLQQRANFHPLCVHAFIFIDRFINHYQSQNNILYVHITHKQGAILLLNTFFGKVRESFHLDLWFRTSNPSCVVLTDMIQKTTLRKSSVQSSVIIMVKT